MKCVSTAILLFIISASFSSQKAFSESLKNVSECSLSSDSCIHKEEVLLAELRQQYSDIELIEYYLESSLLYYQNSKLQIAKQRLYRIIYLSNETDSLKASKAKAYSRLNAAYLRSGDYDSALSSINEAYKIYYSLKDSFSLAKTAVARGMVYKEKGQYPKALEDYLTALDFFKSNRLKSWEASTLGEMATLFAMSGENDKAITYGIKAASIFKSMPSEEANFTYTCLNLANNLIYANKPDTAILLLDEIIPLFKARGENYFLINATAQLSNAYYQKESMPMAFKFMKEAILMDSAVNYLPQAIYNHHLLGRMFQSENEPINALKEFKTAYWLQQKMGANDELKPLLEDISQAYEKLGQSDSALKYLQDLMALQDSLYSIESAKQLTALKQEHAADLREEQLRNQKQEISLLEQSNKAQMQRNITLVAVLIVVIALTLAIISRQRNSLRLTKMISEESEKAHRAEQLKLKEDLNHRQRELASQALLIAEKNEMLRSFRAEVDEVGVTEKALNRKLKSLSRKMERAENKQSDWDKFMHLFENVHPKLIQRLSELEANLTHNDLRLLALMRMGFSNKEIAAILHITDDGLKKARYRLRKKLQHDSASSLHQFIQTF